MKLKVKTHIYHGIVLAFITLSLSLSFLRFSGVIYRMGQAFEDLCTSIGHYFGTLFGLGEVVPTLPTIPAGAVEILPFDPLVFQLKMTFYFDTLFSWDNLAEFGLWLIDELYVWMLALSIILPALGCVFLLIYGVYGLRENNDYGKDTKALAIYKRIEAVTWDKVK